MDFETVAFYDRHASEMSVLYDGADMSRLYESVVDILPRGGAILDVGCGSGRDARALQRLGYDVTACDASERMLEIAKGKLDSINPNNPKIEYLTKAFPLSNDDPFLSRRYDLVLSIAVLMHIPPSEIETFFNQLSMLVKNDGYALLSWCERRPEDERMYCHVKSEDVQTLCKGAGLVTLEMNSEQDSLGRAICWYTMLMKKNGRAIHV